MVFELRPGNDLAEDIRRLGCAQLGQALSHLAGFPARQKGVHDARKCLKRARSLLHIARPAMKPSLARKLDRRTAAIGGALSGTRDCQAMIEALDSLEQHFGPAWSPAVCTDLRAMFQERLKRGTTVPPGSAEKILRQLDRLRTRFANIELERGANPGPGLERTYGRARKRFKDAYQLGDGTAFHDWRKEAQRHWRQMQLMVAAWPEAMTVRIERARALSLCLGDDHDLYILLGHVRAAGPDLAPWSDLERFYDGCIERQLAMRMAALNHGRLLFAERPDAFRKRMMGYWRAATARYMQGMPLTEAPTQTVVEFPVTEAPASAEPPASPDSPSGPPVESKPQNAAE